MSPKPGSPPLARITTLLLLVVTGVIWAGWGITTQQEPDPGASPEGTLDP